MIAYRNTLTDFTEFHERMEFYESLSEDDRMIIYRKEVQKAEKRILNLIGDPFEDFIRKECDSESILNIVEHLLGIRNVVLSKMFRIHCNENEVSRIEYLNTRLLGLSDDMFSRTAQCYRKVLDIPRKKREVVKVTGRLFFADPLEHPVIKMADDMVYGSDFGRIIPVISHILKEHHGNVPVIDCHQSSRSRTLHFPAMSDKDLGLDNQYNDGNSWAKGPLVHPRLEHMAVCYAANSIVNNLGYSVPDLMHMDHFRIDVGMELSNSFKI